MTAKFKHSASIEHYLSNEMAPAELMAFEQELKTNSDLANELKFSQSIDSALMRDDIIDLREKLIATIQSDRDVKKVVPAIEKQTHKWWYAAAAVITIFAVATTLYLQMPRTATNDSLFREYYNAENIVDQTRSNQNIVDAVVKFQQKDFRSASALFKRILETDNSNIAVWFYYGISNIETGNYDNSIKAFTLIINQNDNLYIEHAEWYLGLCYLKSNQGDKAIVQFNNVAANPENFHHLEARNILEKLQGK